MCQLCVDAINKYFPGISDGDRSDLLWSATAFPFDAESVERQLSTLRSQIDELKERPGFIEFNQGASDVTIALALANAETDMCMKNVGPARRD